MESIKSLFRLSLWLLLVGCAPAAALPAAGPPATVISAVEPTATTAATSTPLPAPIMVTALATATTAATSTATALPATATLPPTPSAIPSATPTATPSPTPEFDPAFACRSREELANVRPAGVVVPGPWPRGSAVPGAIFNGSGAGNMLHLGFDVEGDPSYVRELLDVLDQRQVKTTMFVPGFWAEAYPNLVQELARRGHEMANHTFSHGNMKDWSQEEVLSELNRSEELIQQLTGQSTKPWLRPPFGSRSEVSLQAAYNAGWTTLIWSGSTNDWQANATEDLMCANLRMGSFAGAILYSHTYRPEIPAVVDRYIGEMQSRGFVFVPMSVMMAGNPEAYIQR